jgi:hypothetical protein
MRCAFATQRRLPIHATLCNDSYEAPLDETQTTRAMLRTQSYASVTQSARNVTKLN